jgi:pimeloyl-ACP methyl ester carboxylesterase
MNSEDLQSLPLPAEDGSRLSIAYRFRRPCADKPLFVWFYGFKSHMGSLKPEALSAWSKEHGAGCLRFDYSGHGRSGGRFEDGTISAWLDEAAKVYELARASGPAVFVGSSMGGWIALLLALRLQKMDAAATQGSLKGLVLLAPAWDLTHSMWERAPEEARAAIMDKGVYYQPSAYGPPYAITRALLEDGRKHLFGKGPINLDVPVRILHGCQDPDVPWQHSLDLLDILDCSNVRLTLIKDSGHRLSRPQDLQVLFSLLSEFL